jgi:hypothetical protein
MLEKETIRLSSDPSSLFESETDAVIGRLIRERSEVKQQIAFLDTQARHMAREFKTLSRALKKRPQGIVVDGSQDILNPERIRALVSEYKRLIAKEIELNEQLNRFGLDI